MSQTDRPTVTPATIAAAEQLLGIVQTESERALAAEAIAEQMARAACRRQVPLDDDLAPACVFDPRLPGFAMPPAEPLRLPACDQPFPGDDDTAIAFAPVVAQASWIRSGRLTAVRLTRLYLDRIARLDPALLAFARLNPAALDEAAALDARAARGDWAGPLHGIPYACKDIIDTKGLATEWGAEPFLGRVPAADALVVRKLRAAGAVLLGKASVGALAYGDLWYGGRTRNPWNPAEGSSGSSAGSAAAAAAGLCGFALGTETLGSIVSPANRCGAVGLRPTFGRVGRSGTMTLCPSLDKIGVLGRDPADTALVLDSLAGEDPADPSSIAAPFGGDAGRDPAGLRAGYCPADFEDPAVSAAERAMLEHCRALGVTLVARERPDLPYDSLISILMAEAAASFEALTLSDRDDLLAWQEADAWPNQFRMARFLSAVDHVQLDRLRRRVMIAMRTLFDGVDVMIGPALAGPMLCITNFTGHPCLCLPCGLEPMPPREPTDAAPGSPARPVPQAICLWGALFDEAPILALGHALHRRLALDLAPPSRHDQDR